MATSTTTPRTWDEILDAEDYDPDIADLAEQQAIADVGRLTPKTDAAGHDRYWAKVAYHYNRIEAGRAESIRLQAAAEARLAEMEAPAFRCNVCGFTSPTAEADALHWTLAVEADELHGGGDHLDAEAEHADRQIGDRDCGGGFCPDCGADHDAAQAVCDDCAGYTDDPYLPEGMR